ncbi:xylose isomerase [Olea europaea subsp. europaea]|uniref:Xylose isomerase n=1 Tax=Olea europaea subsp. europaea TaxID=158383 RepID=A0A8S0RKI6_OLEEU|nr:xylose isomerase [Olea europaea subsp. europaea]
MKAGKIIHFPLCLNLVSILAFAAGPPTCPVDVGSDCGNYSGEWKGEFFPGIPKIKYEETGSTHNGPSKNPLSFKWYNADKEILGKKMKVRYFFIVAFWHTFRGTGGDPFGAPTKMWPWEDGTYSLAMAKRRMRVNFEFLDKFGVSKWCFHDREIAPDGKTFEESNAKLDEVVALAKELWVTKIRPLCVAFWHTFRGTGGDPFGAPTKMWPWEDGTYSLAMAKRRMRVNFEFLDKFGVSKWCFHDRDIAPDGKTFEESNAKLDEVVALAKELWVTKIRPLWCTAQLFHHPRYMHGGRGGARIYIHPYLGVYAYSAAQVKKTMEARFMEAAVAYKKKIGFNGTLLIEPKPQEPAKHQYDRDAATAANFLRNYRLIDEFKLNIECNHATLAGHSCHHELETARINGLLGNIDANTGDPQIGWDTDQFMIDIGEATLVMLSVIENGGLAPGGFNFDAKLRRESTDVDDIFIAHIAGMDTLARGLRNAAKLIEDGSLAELVRKRYESFDTEIGAQIEAGKVDFDTLEKKAIEWGEPKVSSAKQILCNCIMSSVGHFAFEVS